MKFLFALVAVFTLVNTGWAQDSIRYTPDFEFYDGLYLDFEDFRNDNPIPFESVISTYRVSDPIDVNGPPHFVQGSIQRGSVGLGR